MNGVMRGRVSRFCVRSALCGTLLLFGCGSGEQPGNSGQTAPPQPFVQVDPTINVCPRFGGSLIIPEDISPGLQAEVAVIADDPDGSNARLVFSWTASAGLFSAADRPTTGYTCSEAGPQVLNISARDPLGCTSSLALNVTCLAH